MEVEISWVEVDGAGWRWVRGLVIIPLFLLLFIGNILLLKKKIDLVHESQSLIIFQKCIFDQTKTSNAVLLSPRLKIGIIICIISITKIVIDYYTQSIAFSCSS